MRTIVKKAILALAAGLRALTRAIVRANAREVRRDVDSETGVLTKFGSRHGR